MDWSRRFPILLLVALGFSSWVLTVPTWAAECGDCSGDGQVDVLDALLVSQHDVGLVTLDPSQARLGDVNADRRTDIVDGLRIAQTAAGKRVLLLCLPEPYPPAAEVYEGTFATSLACADCHSNAPAAVAMRDELGTPIGMFDLWQSSMMANSARNPFWRAQVSAEIQAIPSRSREIQEKCMRCHAPMASEEAEIRGEPFPQLDVLTAETPRGELARDGVSCTFCHQIQPDDFGTLAVYFGSIDISTTREMFGPHDSPAVTAMELASSFKPARGDHVLESGLCGNCHTQITDTLDTAGNETGARVFEQSPYGEWQNSSYNDETIPRAPLAASCQDCHMPKTSAQGVPIHTRIARTAAGTDDAIPPRSPYGRHVLVGGNTLIPSILRDHASELGVLAPPQAFDTTIALAREQLSQRTATLTLETPTRQVDDLLLPVQVQNLCGHKFPSGYPSRRAWIRLKVVDATGNTVFLSGEHDVEGRILDGRGQPHPTEQAGGPIEPHHQLIDDPDRVQVYESVLEDGHGQPTFFLMQAAGFHKDNRIVPIGWDPAHPDIANMEPTVAAVDADYSSFAAAGADRVVYRVHAPASAGPYSVEATLFYQTLRARTAAQLFETQTSEIAAFRNYYETADRSPSTVASDAISVP